MKVPAGWAEEKIRFTSSILPKWARRTKSLDALLPVLYLRGVSTGEFQALAALLGGRTRCPCSQNERSPGHSPAAFRAVCGLVLKPVPRIGGLAFRLIE